MIDVGSHPAWHPLFEALGYVAGYLVYRGMRARRGDVLDDGTRWSVIAAAAVGAVVGSRLLGLAEQWPAMVAAWKSGRFLNVLLAPGGKTIVGGLLGGWCGVELMKRLKGIGVRTGDLFAIPLCVGIAVGRIGCLVAGLADDTYGKPTTLPWAVNLGDGVGRQPVQVYEIVFLMLLASALARRWRAGGGELFRIFLAAYLTWRLIIDFLKPQPLLGGMNVIQWACCGGLLALGWLWLKDRKPRRQGNYETADA